VRGQQASLLDLHPLVDPTAHCIRAMVLPGPIRLDVRTDSEGQKHRRLEVVAERVRFVEGTGAIRAAIPREPPIDRPAQDFEADAPARIAEADPPAPDD
jgi:hypothetical protein